MGIKVIDKAGQQEIEVSSAEAQRGIQQGEYLLKDPTVSVTRGGEIGDVDTPDLATALNQGWTLVDPEEATSFTLRRDAESVGGQVIGGAEAVASGATLGLSTLAEESLGVDPEGMRLRREGLGKGGTGLAMAGAIVPSLFTGGAGAAATGGRLGAVARATPAGALSRAGARLGESVAGTTGASRVVVPGVQGALEGFGAGIGAEVDESVLGERELAAERLFMRGGAGLLLGGAGGAVVGGLAAGMGGGLRAGREVLGQLGGKVDDLGGSGVARGVLKLGGVEDDAAARLSGYHESPEKAAQLFEWMEKGAKAEQEIAESMRPAFEDLRAGLSAGRQIAGTTRKASDLDRMLPHGADETSRMNNAAISTLEKVEQLLDKRIAQHVADVQGPTGSTLGGQASQVGRARTFVGRARDEMVAAAGPLRKSAIGRYHALDELRQDLFTVRQTLKTAAKRSGSPEAEEAFKIVDEAHETVRKALVDDAVWGKAAQAQREISEASRRGFEARDELTGHSAAVLNTDAPLDNAALLTVTRNGGRWAGATKTELLESAVEAEVAWLRSIKKHRQLTPEESATLDQALDAAKRFRTALDEQGERVNALRDVETVRNLEGGRSPSLGLGGGVRPLVSNVGSGAAAGAAIGGVVGGPIGAAAGGLIGGAYGVIKTVAAHPYTTFRMMTRMRAKLTDAQSKQAAATAGFLKQVAGKALRAGGLFGTAAKKTAPQMIRLRKERNEKAKQRAAELVNNPQMLADELRRATMDMEDVAPRLAKAYADKATQAAIYLAKNTPPSYQAPLSHRKPLVDPIAQAEYERRVETVMDPLGALERLENGTFTKEHAEAIRAVYPALFRDIQQQIMTAVADAYAHGREIPLSTATQLSVLFDLPIDPTLGMAPTIARAFGVPPSAPPPPAQQPNKDFKIDTDRYKTPMQSLGMIRMEA